MSAKITLKEVKELFKKKSFQSGFVKPVIGNVDITEQNSASSLKKVKIINIPHSGNQYDPLAWIANLEMKHPVFGVPTGSKTCEQALIVLLNRAINVFLFELKSSLEEEGNRGLMHIQEKITDSSARVAYLLPLYFSDEIFENALVRFWGIVCYNNDNIALINVGEEERKTKIYEILKEKEPPKGRLYIEDNPLLEEHRVEVFFFKNPSQNTSSMTIDFQDFYTKNIGNTDLRCVH